MSLLILKDALENIYASPFERYSFFPLTLHYYH